MSEPRIPDAVAAQLAALGVGFTTTPRTIELPSGITLTCRPFGADDDARAFAAVGELVGHAQGLMRYCREYGFAWDIRPIAKASTDPLWLEGLVQFGRAVELAHLIVTEVSNGDATQPPTKGLLGAIMADKDNMASFLTQAIPPRLVDQNAAKRAGARARDHWNGRAADCATCRASEFPCRATAVGCHMDANKPRTRAEKIAASMIALPGLWRSGAGAVGLDWAGARALCPDGVKWTDVQDCLAAMEQEWRNAVDRAREAANPGTTDPHGAGVYDGVVQGGGMEEQANG